MVLVLIVVFTIIATVGQTSMGATVKVDVRNQRCKGPVEVSQFTFLRGGIPLKIRVLRPAREVELDQTRTFTFELENNPSTVVVTGRDDRGRKFDAQVELGQGTEYSCGIIRARGGEAPDGEGQTGAQPGQGQQGFPPQLQGLYPGINPQAVITRLRNNGASVEEQGSRNNPKLGNVRDPLMIGNLEAGFTATAYWVQGPGQLRSVVSWDRPSTRMALVVVSTSMDFCASVSPASGGLEASCDSPTEPQTTTGNAPVSGNTFLVSVVKLGGPSQSYVLALSG